MTLHTACPVQPSNAAYLDARNRSVSPRSCPGAPPYCPMQELSRTPQTHPISGRSPTQTWWSAACAYARRRESLRHLVAEVRGQHAPSGYRPDVGAGRGPALCSRLGGCPTQVGPYVPMSRETPQRGCTFGINDPKVRSPDGPGGSQSMASSPSTRKRPRAIERSRKHTR